MKTRISFILVLCLGLSLVVQAQKQPLTHEVYDDWKNIQSINISNDGSWAGYRVVPQVGDAVLKLRKLSSEEEMTIDRVSRYRFSHNSQYVVAEIKPEYDKVREMKLKKTSKAKMPKDSLYIISLATGDIEKVARVKSFKAPDESGEWISWLHEKLDAKARRKKEKEAEKQAAAEGEKEQEEPEGKKKKKGKRKKGKKGKKGEEEQPKPKPAKKPKSKSKGTELVLYNMSTGEKKSFEGVVDYHMSEKGNFLFYEQDEADSLNPAGVYAYNTGNGELTVLNEGMEEYKKMVSDESGTQLAFMATANTKDDDHKYFSLMYWKAGQTEAAIIADTTTAGVPEGWMISDNGTLRFSESGARLYMRTAPRPIKYDYEEDTTILKEERPEVDVWSYNDPYIQPMQKNRVGQERNRSYDAVIDLSTQRLVQLGGTDLESIRIDFRADHDYYLSAYDKPYRTQFTWDTQIPRDIYQVNVNNGEAELLMKGTKGFPSMSPGGKYMVLFNPEDGHWYSMDVKSRNLVNLTEGMEVSFANELHDSPSLAGNYGAAGWLDNDEAMYLNDRYDIWKFDPTGKTAPVNITNGEGRKNKVRYRYVRLDREARTITGERQVLSVFNEWTKASGYARADFSKPGTPFTLLVEDMSIYGMTKARDADNFLLRKGTYVDYPEVYAGTGSVNDPLVKISNVGVQEEPYNRGTAELIEFNNDYDGETMQAILYKPENFDPNKKYPMIVYFYERRSNSLHSHPAPAPSASTVNIPYYVSNDYLVLVPDIKYEEGYPGRSALNHVVPATKAVTNMGFVNEDKMAIQGQSWGGYQVAYIVTRTDMYAAAGAGAPVSNMTSAYGGVRWGSGMSRMFQYEKTQSRLGATLWDRQDLYIENSPIFKVPDINTPLFIMHNDNDGAVPWYQGIEFYMSLRRLQKPAWMVVYNKEAHNLRQRKNRKDLSIRMGQFFDHFLKDAPMPEWMAYGLPATLKDRTLRYDLVEEEPTEKPKEGQRIEVEKTKGGGK